MYEYRARFLYNYDGDTIDFQIDLGFDVLINIRVRLARVDTPELRGNERELGLIVKENVRKKMMNAEEIVIKTYKDRKGKYGRYIGEVIYDDINLSDYLLAEGLATEYLG